MTLPKIKTYCILFKYSHPITQTKLMINTKAIVYSSIAAILLSGTAAQAQQYTDEERPDIVHADVEGISFELKKGDQILIEDLSTASGEGGSGSKIDYIYNLGQVFYINLQTNQQVLGVAPEDAQFDYLQFDEFSTVLDPLGTFGFTFRDFGTPSTFSSTLNFPAFNPSVFGDSVYFSASIGASLTDGGSDGIGINAGNQTKTMVAKLINNNNEQIASIALGDTFFGTGNGAGGTYTYGAFNSNLFDQECGVLGCKNVQIDFSFTGTGNSDRYAFSGGWFVGETAPAGVSPASTADPAAVTVPEPSTTAGLVGLGLLGLVFARGKRA
ncbi:PEP-CTERM sorting domain-containing protein [Crocosphaera sp. XPORK-15E]|uniref:PEP-CTERM sorting domain-containing protein n=1 Tax=Crocosphaera sp. XPORK-15E TaxID=3110247 RepID=UPI002B21E5D9|nr:PEP-CTERM sorting domain-containing protein [Crocosphaera sp. XPORK-15E]MEA5533502.1 PEP-CTERM sorting domain-containing protein [Crocosphaera sp. XPORK-15E]